MICLGDVQGLKRHFDGEFLKYFTVNLSNLVCCKIFKKLSKYLIRFGGHADLTEFPNSLRDGLVMDVSFVCELKGNNRAPGGWNNGVRHSNDVLHARVKVKKNKYKDVYGLVTRRLYLPL